MEGASMMTSDKSWTLGCNPAFKDWKVCGCDAISRSFVIGASLSEPLIYESNVREIYIYIYIVRPSSARRLVHIYHTEAACNVFQSQSSCTKTMRPRGYQLPAGHACCTRRARPITQLLSWISRSQETRIRQKEPAVRRKRLNNGDELRLAPTMSYILLVYMYMQTLSST